MKMSKLLFICLIFVSTNLFSKSFWVRVGKQKTQLKIIRDGFISKDCIKKCKALDFLDKNPDIKNLPLSNPFAQKCKVLGGSILLGELYSGHSQSFCQARDKSIVSTNLL